MKVLAFDTSTDLGTVVLTDDGQVLAEASGRVRARHGETLLPHIERCLSVAGVERDDLDCIVVGIGPGSFTGLRIGIATAKGLALALNKCLVGVSSFEAMALGVCVDGVVVTISDAQKQEVFVAAYRVNAGRVQVVNEPFIASPAEAAKFIREADFGIHPILCGSGVRRYPDEFEDSDFVIASPLFDAPRAAQLAALMEILESGDSGITDVRASLEPLYVRPSDSMFSASSGTKTSRKSRS